MLYIRALLISLLITGCASTSTDPSKGGFIGGLKGVVGGEYEKRIQKKESEIDELDTLNNLLEQRLNETKSKHASIKQDIREYEQLVKSTTVSIQNTWGLIQDQEKEKLLDERELKILRFHYQDIETLLLEITLKMTELEVKQRQLSQDPDNEVLIESFKQEHRATQALVQEVDPKQAEFNALASRFMGLGNTKT